MLSILLPVNKFTEYFLGVVSSLISSVMLLKIPTQLVVVINSESISEKALIEEALNYYHFEKILIQTAADNLSDVLNFGLDFCKYDLVARMDQDDVSLRFRFQAQVEFLIQNPDFALIGGQTVLLDSENRVIGEALYPVFTHKIQKQLRYSNCFAHPAVMFRKSQVLKVGGYKNDFPMSEDYYLWVRLAKSSKVANLNQYVLKYRVHSDQSSSTNSLIQLISTIRIVALNLEINEGKLETELARCLMGYANPNFDMMFEIDSLKNNKELRAATALLILRRSSIQVQLNFFQKFNLIRIAVGSRPYFTFCNFGSYLVRRINRFILKKNCEDFHRL
jgi:glycosyltransferase involved in cell wall biosynthesis